MKIKFSIKSSILLLLIVNSHCVDLLKLKKSPDFPNRQSKQKKNLIIEDLSKKVRFNQNENKIAPVFAAYLISTAIDSITSIITNYANAKEAELKSLKEKGISTLVNMFEEVKLLKSGLCSNIRNSNFFFFDYLSYIIMEIYFMRNKAKDFFLGKELTDIFKAEYEEVFVDEKINIDDYYIKDNEENENENIDGFNFDNDEENFGEGADEFRKLVLDEKNITRSKSKNGISHSMKKNSEIKYLLNKAKNSPKQVDSKEDSNKVNDQQLLPNNIVAPVLKENPNKTEIITSKKIPPNNQNRMRFTRVKTHFSKYQTSLTNIEIIRNLLEPYDVISQSLFNIKQRMKSLQNNVCSLSNDIVGEMTFIAARSRGIATAMQEESEGSFFMVANMILDFANIFTTLGIQASLEEVRQIDENEYTKFKEKFKGDPKDLPKDNQIDGKNYLDMLAFQNPLPTFILNPHKFVVDTIEDIKIMYRFMSSKEYKNPLGEIIKPEDFKKLFLESLIKTLSSVITVAVFIKFLQEFKDDNSTQVNPNVPGTMYKLYILFPIEAVKNAVINGINYFWARDELNKFEILPEGGYFQNLKLKASYYIASKKFKFSMVKVSLLIAFWALAKVLFGQFLKLVMALVMQMAKTSSFEDQKKAALSVLNVFLVFKIIISLTKLVLAIMKYIKVNRELKKFKIDFYAEQKLRGNILQHVQIQSIYITFRHNSLIYSTFVDILKFYENLKTDFVSEQMNHSGKSKKPLPDLEVDQILNGIVEYEKAIKKEGNNRKTRYNDLKLNKFYLKFCQENELFCYNTLTPTHLKKIHENHEDLKDKDIDGLFKYIYNDVVAGPITDAFVVEPLTTTLTQEYLLKNNYRFYKDSINFGAEYALLYKRGGNSNNYVVGIEYLTMELPKKLYESFEAEKAFREKNGDEKSEKFGSQINSFFTSNAKFLKKVSDQEVKYERKYILLKSITIQGIDDLRGDNIEEKNVNQGQSNNDDEDNKKDAEDNTEDKTGNEGSQKTEITNKADKDSKVSLIYSFNNSQSIEFNFKKMYFVNLQNESCDYEKFDESCFYFFSFAKIEDIEIDPLAQEISERKPKLIFVGDDNDEKNIMDVYINSCYKNTKFSIILSIFAKDLDNNESFFFTSNFDNAFYPHATVLDKRYFSDMKDCSLNFSMLDKRVVDVSRHKLDSADTQQYLESQIDCFNEKMTLAGLNGATMGEFKYETQMNLLKSKIEGIKLPVCSAYELLREKYKLPKDSTCTKVGPKDFRYIYALGCSVSSLDDEKNLSFFTQIKIQYNIDYKHSKGMLYTAPDDKNIEINLEPNEAPSMFCPLMKDKNIFFKYIWNPIKRKYLGEKEREKFDLLKGLSTNFNFLRYENPIPPISFLTDMFSDTKINPSENLRLLHYSTQFYEYEQHRFPVLKTIWTANGKRNNYINLMTPMVGPKGWFHGRPSGIFHIVLPFTRIKIIGSKPGNLVFQVDKELTTEFRKFNEDAILKEAEAKFKKYDPESKRKKILKQIKDNEANRIKYQKEADDAKKEFLNKKKTNKTILEKSEAEESNVKYLGKQKKLDEAIEEEGKLSKIKTNIENKIQELTENKDRNTIKIKSCIFKVAIVDAADEPDQNDRNNAQIEKKEMDKLNDAGSRPTSLSNIKLEYAPMSTNFYIELNLFEAVRWYEFMTKDNQEAMNLRGLDDLIEQCFIIYWPKLDQAELNNKDHSPIEPEATVNYYIPFRYSDRWTLMKRIWVKFDYYVKDEVLERICESQFGIDEEMRKKKKFLKLRKKMLLRY